ncbi:MAG: helix-turn-helix transcriptional regulator [Butyricicoccus sp.]|nr:helix-turn-helix transcriptional regulator [Butyricicoccus sp.]MDY4087320.1 helix-turn-helix transcriptional regulator [Butyricicoccus intestinisimiae]
MTVGDRVKTIRKELMLNQTQFAEKIGISQRALSSIERETTNLTERNTREICRVFNVNEQWLRTGEGEMFLEPSEDEQLAEFVGEILAGRPDDMRRQFLVALSQLDEDGWKGLVQFTRAIYKEGKKLEEGKEKEQG